MYVETDAYMHITVLEQTLLNEADRELKGYEQFSHYGYTET